MIKEKTKKINNIGFYEGMRDGVPIALGYFAVAFSLGITARKAGLNALQGFISSVLNHASAGEYAEFTVIQAGAPYIEMALIILVTNARYLLMSCALSQRFDKNTGMLHRILVGFGITDEIFGASIARKGAVDPWYHYGAMLLAIPAWACGTAIGIIAGNILPVSVVSALSVAIYGMFLAVIIPPAKKDRAVLVVVAASMVISTLFAVVPVLQKVSSGFVIIITTILVAGTAAYFCPVQEEEGDAHES